MIEHRYYTVLFGDTDICDEFGASLASFKQVPPDPKVVKVDVPGGADIDITEAIGPVAFHNGLHRLVLAFTGAGIADGIRGLMNLVHGNRSEYSLSWDEGYIYTGRWEVTDIERISDHLENVTVEIDRYPWKVKSESITLAANPTASHMLEGSERYANVTIQAGQDGTADIGGTEVPFETGTTTLAAQVDGDQEVTVTLDDWICYLDGENLVVNTAYYALAGEDAQFSIPPFERVGDELQSDQSLNEVVLSYTRKDL